MYADDETVPGYMLLNYMVVEESMWSYMLILSLFYAFIDVFLSHKGAYQSTYDSNAFPPIFQSCQ